MKNTKDTAKDGPRPEYDNVRPQPGDYPKPDAQSSPRDGHKDFTGWIGESYSAKPNEESPLETELRKLPGGDAFKLIFGFYERAGRNPMTGPAMEYLVQSMKGQIKDPEVRNSLYKLVGLAYIDSSKGMEGLSYGARQSLGEDYLKMAGSSYEKKPVRP